MSNRRSHIISFAAKIRVIYSVSIDDDAIVSCFFEYQFIVSLLNMKIKPTVDFEYSLLPTEFKSEYPFIKNFSGSS